jgi:hypothetical protein
MSESDTSRLSMKEKPETINDRLFDLCRYQRSELFEAELIDSEEYFFLMHDCPLARGSGSPSPRRLENYDSIRENLKTVTEQRDRLAEALSLIEREEKPTSMKIFSSKAIATKALQSLTNEKQ